jgi:lipopolysaccharide biosynthesis protein
MFAILIHIYYPDSWKKIFLSQLLQLQVYAPMLMINLYKNASAFDTAAAIRNDFPDALLLTTPNKGKDIGGKLALIDLYLKTKQEADYIIFLHDKISPHAITGEKWRAKLFSIIDPANIKAILKEFRSNTNIGIVGAKDFVQSEFDDVSNQLETTNRIKIDELIKNFNLTIADYTFVAGTMFWIRSGIVTKFFSKFSPLRCREVLEEGDFTDQYEGTYTHSWERIFCWLATSQNFKVKGI